MISGNEFAGSLGREAKELLCAADFSGLLLENIDAAVVACDQLGKLVLFNRTAREWHGMDPCDIPQSEWADHYGLFESDGVTPMTFDTLPLLRAFRGEMIKDVEVVIAAKNQPPREVLCSGTRILDEEGQVFGAVVVMKDITKRKRTEEQLRASEEKFRTIADYTLDWETWFGMDGKVLWVNPAMERISGYTIEEFVNAPDMIGSMVVQEDRKKVYAAFREALQGSRGNEFEFRVLRKDGSWFWLEANWQPVFDKQGRPLGVRSSGRDISDRKRMEDELREGRDMLARLTNQVPGVVYKYRLYPDGRSCFPFASEGMNTIYEVTPEEVREDATPVFGRLHPLDYDHVSDSIKESARTLQPFHCEFRVVLPRQGFRWRLSDALPQRLEDGSTLWYGIITDITERKRAEDELQNLRTAVDQSANTVVITDPSGRIEYANPAFEKSTGYTPAEAIGHNPRVLKSGEQDADFYQRLWSTISSGEIWQGQFHNRRKDGTLYWESATISPVLNALGEVIHYIAIKEDITERKALEANLLEALNRAESANRAKSEFLAVMSHELRTPLNGVLGFAELLSATPLNDEQMDYARTITSSGNHLLDVVNDILDFSSLEKDRLVLDSAPVKISELVESSTLPISKAAADKGLEFLWEIDPEAPGQIMGDERRIRQILINLLGNAVKFTGEGSVRLRVATSTDPEKETLDFSIEDTGPGLSGELLALLFTPFTQADTTLHRQFEGTGLGLAISQRLAKAMGGQITVVSAPAKGSTFTLHLPLRKAPSLPPATRSGDDATAALPAPLDRCVLVAEDDPSNRLLAGKMLDSLGYRADFAVNGKEAVALFSPGKYDAILMDMQMPVMDGLEASRMIREIEASGGGRVQIIALTANVMPGDSDRCFAAGMDLFIAKPFKRETLAAKLAGAIRGV